MDNFNYAHNDTSRGERKTYTADFNRPSLSEEIKRLRENAFVRRVPTAGDETIKFLKTLLSAVKPENILELGTAVGISGCVMLDVCGRARLTTVERNEDFYTEAKRNFSSLGFDNRVKVPPGVALAINHGLAGGFDFIFLDCAKAQYVKYLPRLKRLLKRGGTLIADDILLFGYVTGEEAIPPKRKMLVEHIKEYITAVTNDSGLQTTIINIGNGVALSVKL